MKKILFFTAFAAMIILAGCTAKSNATAEFWVRGNCDMCKETIETALNGVDGVAEATYNVEANTATVHYDSTKTTVMDLHKACGSVGYHTKEVEAVVEAYDALPKCCKKPEDM